MVSDGLYQLFPQTLKMGTYLRERILYPVGKETEEVKA